MKNNTYQRYIVWGVTVFTVIALSIILFFMIFRMQGISDTLANIVYILQPILYGVVMAYVLNPIYRRIEYKLTPILRTRFKKPARAVSLSRFTATMACLIVTFLIIWGIYLILPELVKSVFGIAQQMPTYISNLEDLLLRLFEDNESVGPLTLEMYQNVTDYIYRWLSTDLLPLIYSWLGYITGGVLSMFNMIKNVFIGIIVMVYLLNGKQTFAAQGKKVVYSLLPVKRANLMIDNVRYTHYVFGGFINGKLLDSLIIGLITFAYMLITKTQYEVLISVIIGVMNIIPFFGPFIGAIPSIILLLFVDPISSIYFAVFILVLQQVDGNIIGPKILGDTTGLPSFWVLFSILLFGGLFGFVGMILAVPVFALLYSLIAALVNRSLHKRMLPTQTDLYRDLHHIGAGDHQLIKVERDRKQNQAPVTKVKIKVDEDKPASETATAEAEETPEA